MPTLNAYLKVVYEKNLLSSFNNLNMIETTNKYV